MRPRGSCSRSTAGAGVKPPKPRWRKPRKRTARRGCKPTTAVAITWLLTVALAAVVLNAADGAPAAAPARAAPRRGARKRTPSAKLAPAPNDPSEGAQAKKKNRKDDIPVPRRALPDNRVVLTTELPMDLHGFSNGLGDYVQTANLVFARGETLAKGWVDGLLQAGTPIPFPLDAEFYLAAYRAVYQGSSVRRNPGPAEVALRAEAAAVHARNGNAHVYVPALAAPPPYAGREAFGFGSVWAAHAASTAKNTAVMWHETYPRRLHKAILWLLQTELAAEAAVLWMRAPAQEMNDAAGVFGTRIVLGDAANLGPAPNAPAMFLRLAGAPLLTFYPTRLQRQAVDRAVGRVTATLTGCGLFTMTGLESDFRDASPGRHVRGWKWWKWLDPFFRLSDACDRAAVPPFAQAMGFCGRSPYRRPSRFHLLSEYSASDGARFMMVDTQALYHFTRDSWPSLRARATFSRMQLPACPDSYMRFSRTIDLWIPRLFPGVRVPRVGAALLAAARAQGIDPSWRICGELITDGFSLHFRWERFFVPNFDVQVMPARGLATEAARAVAALRRGGGVANIPQDPLHKIQNLPLYGFHPDATSGTDPGVGDFVMSVQQATPGRCAVAQAAAAIGGLGLAAAAGGGAGLAGAGGGAGGPGGGAAGAGAGAAAGGAGAGGAAGGAGGGAGPAGAGGAVPGRRPAAPPRWRRSVKRRRAARRRRRRRQLRRRAGAAHLGRRRRGHSGGRHRRRGGAHFAVSSISGPEYRQRAGGDDHKARMEAWAKRETVPVPAAPGARPSSLWAERRATPPRENSTAAGTQAWVDHNLRVSATRVAFLCKRKVLRLRYTKRLRHAAAIEDVIDIMTPVVPPRLKAAGVVPTICKGGWAGGTRRYGQAQLPHKTLHKALRRKEKTGVLIVINVNEHKTSSFCSGCRGRLGRRGPRWGVKRCRPCRVWLNRDINAARNMLLVLFELILTGQRPMHLR